MRKTYTIKRVNLESKDIKEVWETIPEAAIDCYPWADNDYMPQAKAKVFYTDSHLHVFFQAYEDQIRAVYSQPNDPVCRDSCVEFFFNPNPDGDNRYMNIEMNPIGTFLLGLGKDRHDRILVSDVSGDFLQISTSVDGDSLESYTGPFWTVEYAIPFSFIQRFYGPLDFRRGWRMKGNFYKCGDDTPKPHFGCWNCVVSLIPDFHRPECFGDFILGE